MDARRLILRWVEQEALAPSSLPRALALAEALPTQENWRRFLDRLLLWLGMALVASGLIFFLAYNWKELGRLAKFSLAEAMVAGAMLFVWRLGLDRPSGKAALFGACLFLGALLALIGQTYQTGADTFELFGSWAAMILPWVLVGRSSYLWLLWLAIVNAAITFYFQVLPGRFGAPITTEHQLWTLFAFDTGALLLWEGLAARRPDGLRQRLGPRVLATASGAFVTALVMLQILDEYRASAFGTPAWLVWLAAALAIYRRTVKDLFVLAGGVLSVILIVATYFAKHLTHTDSGGFLVVGLIVVLLSAAGGWWLKHLAAGDEQ